MNFLEVTLREESTDYSKNPEKCFEIFHIVLNTHAPRKKYAEGNIQIANTNILVVKKRTRNNT